MNIGQDKSAESRMATENRILYIDEHLAVFNKAAGDICAERGTERGAESEENGPYLPEVFCESLKQSPAFKERIPPFIHCFNRLDRPVSGCVLLVFNRSLIPLLQNQFTQRQKNGGFIRKRYIALLEGLIPSSPDFELLDHYIRFDGKKQKAFVYSNEQRKTKRARLLWRPAVCTERYTLAEVELLTGRTHQIRAQLAYKGFHIKGDVKYGARRNDPLGGIRLHAVQLCFRHPLSDTLVDVHAPLLKTDALWDAVLRQLNFKET